MLKALKRVWIGLFLGFAGMAQGSTLSDLAASMQPGAWAELQTIGFNQNLLVAPNSHHILQFSDDIIWDANGRKLVFVGGGHGSGAGHIVYNELTNTWVRITLSWGGGFSHAYDHSAIIPSRNTLYHRRPEDDRVWALNLTTGVWTTTAAITDNVQCCGALEYFPELGTLIFVDGDWGVFSYNPNDNRWTQMSAALAMGDYHNVAEYSPVHKVLTFGGGGGNAEGAASNRAVFRMNASGTISQGASSPINFGIYDTVTTTDPISGNMLVFGNNDSYEYNPATNSWRRFAGRAPFVTAGEMTTVFGSVATPIAEYGVVLVATYNGNSSKVFLYKHSAGSPQPAPTVTLSANPTTVAPQGTSTLTWSSTDANSCTASGGNWTGTKATSGSEAVGPLSATTTYTLTCTGTGGGSTSRSVTVTVNNPTPAPTVTLSANPTSVPAQGSSTLTWSSTNATGCTASGGWSGARATSGSATVGPLASATTYNLSCTGAGGTTQRSVTVNLLPAPGVTFSANPTTVTAGARSTLTWSSTNATGCVASGAWAGNKASSGSEQTPVLNSTSTFTLQCTGTGGSTSRSVTVTVNGAPPPPPPPAPTVTLSANPTSVAPQGTSTLTWSSTNATSCTASGGWSGTKATSGTEAIGPLSNTTNYTLQCTGAGGNATDSETVTVTAGGGGGGGTPPDDSGGGSVDLLALLALLVGLFARGLQRFRIAVMTAALGTLAATSVMAATPEEDWQARSTHPDVVRAISFDTLANINDYKFPDGNFERAGSGWDQSNKASGAGSLHFVIPSNSEDAGSGSWRINYSDSPFPIQFGANEEFYIQWRQRFDANFLSTFYSGGRGWKQIIIAEGDVAGSSGEAHACVETEVVVQNTYQRGMPQMYHACGYFTPFEQGVNGSDYKLQNGIPSPYCLYSNNVDGGPGDTTTQPPCFGYVANEWMTFQVHVKLGPRGTGSSSLDGPGITGFTNSTVQMWAARAGQPSVLIHDWPGLVLRESAGKEYGKLWLLPFHTNKSSGQSHPVGHTWYDELIVSRSRIADPGATTAPGPTVTLNANPTSVAPQGSSTLTWSTTNATGCTASGGWSGTKAVNGSESVGPLAATTTYTLNCTATGGGSTSRSVTVTVNNPTPAPTVTLSANPTSVPAQGNSTLTWSSTNATGCTASGGWSGARATSGSAPVGPIAASTTYNLSCTGAGGTTQRSVTVNLLPAPGVTFSANPTTVTAGARSTLTWSSTNATGCTASGAWAGNKATSGSEQTPVLNSTSTFTLGCNGAGGTTSRSVTVTVNGTPPPPPPPAPTVTLSTNPTSVAPQGTSTLTWSSTNATSCTASGGWSGTKATSGNQAVGPLTNTATYTLSCTGAGGTASDSETVTVTAGGGGGGGTPPDEGGGGGVDLLALLALLAGLMTRGLRFGRTFAFG